MVVGAAIYVPSLLNRHAAEIAFIAKASADSPAQVYAVDPETGTTTALTSFATSGQDANEVAFSPDGRTLAFTARSAAGPIQLYFVDPSGSGPRQMTNLTGGVGVEDLLWSPDGSRLAFSVLPTDGSTADVSMIKPPDVTIVRLSQGASGSSQFQFPSSWSPDGRRLAYVNASPKPASSLMNADGSGAASVGSSGWSDPAWSPDGAWLLFDNGPALELSAADGSGAHELVRLPVPTGSTAFIPLWSPDGRRIAVSEAPFNGSSAAGAATKAYVLAADGSGLTALAGSLGNVLSPVWSPDGRFVAYFAFDSGSTGSGRLFIAGSDGLGAHAVSGELWTTGFVYPSWRP